ncbi:hypothetical protein APA_424 [Pseudanabaena sp. lw0831]|uniref:protein kinase domain-containing protein n=1 Tax=Pseudanabaena sp. lw0831 TaxID=1357935 RepID=UPI001915B87E|nr:ankyrin repeat domain-containing protein [Pseudanabaena sp. lw0831]GBO52755.1 hypothetical protein APA_424 [Pseudanabaena sp. lw0831]
MTTPNEYQLAKQGDPNAIATYLNEMLKGQGISASAKRLEECLLLAIASDPIADRETLVDAVRLELIDLESRSITKVRMGARQIGQKDFAWQAEFDLDYPKPFPSLDLSLAMDDEEAKDGLHGIGYVIRDRYQILEILGQGGNGITYAATDLQQNKKVAVKALSLRHMNDWKQIELFEREAKVLSQLDHVAIPKYFDFFTIDTEEDRAFYIVQELALGQNLAKLIEAGWRTNEKGVKKIAEQVLNILIYLHGLSPSVIHRDIKPHNLIYGDDGKVSLVDFGAVQDTYRSAMARGSTVIGTFGYMAPEQFRGQAVSATDLFSLGATILFILTHRSPSELPQERLRYDFRSKIKVSEQFADWLQKMVEPDLGDRFASASESLAALQKKQIVWFPRRRLSWKSWIAIAGIGSISAVLISINKWMILSFYDIYPKICSFDVKQNLNSNTITKFISEQSNKKLEDIQSFTEYVKQSKRKPEDIQELIDYVKQSKKLSNKFPSQDTDIDRCITENLNVEMLDFLSQNGTKLDYQGILLSTKSEEVIDWLISKKVDINAKDKNNKTALSNAVLNYFNDDGNINIVKHLIKNGADINHQDNLGQTPLHYAVVKKDDYVEYTTGTSPDGSKHYTVVKTDSVIGRYPIKKIEEKDMPKRPMDQLKLVPKSSDIILFLLQSGANINVKDIYGATPLHFSIADMIGTRQFQCLLQKLSDECIEAGFLPFVELQLSYMYSKSSKTKLLIENGADINTKDNNGNTPLDYAFRYVYVVAKDSKHFRDYERYIKDSWQLQILYYLSSKGANINNFRKEYLQICLIYAIDNEDFDFAKLLIDKGANVNVKSSYDFTYLYHAFSVGYMPIVKLLIENNANVNMINSDGKTALSVSRNNEIAKFLIEKGAK